MKLRAMGLVGGCLYLLVTGGCSPSQRSAYVPGYHYAPQPEMVTIFSKDQKPAVNVLVSVAGIRRATSTAPQAMEVRMRFENRGTATAVFDPGGMSLVTGVLQPFGPPQLSSSQPLQIAPGRSAMLSALFPFPPGVTVATAEPDKLRLLWQVQIDAHPVQQTAYFERTATVNYDARGN